MARHTLAKARQPLAMSELSFIRLISHPSKIRVVLNRLKAKAEELLVEEQAGFRLRAGAQ